MANGLANNGTPTEAEFRTAVGRYYYSAFLHARDRLLSLARISSPDITDVHGKVVKATREKKRSLGDQLDSLRRLRTEADYVMITSDPSLTDWSKNSSAAKKTADRIIPSLQTM